MSSLISLQDNEIVLVQQALGCRHVELKLKRLNCGINDRQAAAFTTLITANWRLWNKLDSEMLSRNREAARHKKYSW